MRKLKNDDRGVTLVEIIVSIAILAIIVLPFLNAFVTATKTNVKAKNEMNATHLATNIMEGIEKNSMKTLAYQFNYPSEGFDVADGFNISDGSSACELLKKSGKFDNVKRLEDISAEIVNKDDVITSCIHKTDASAKISDTSLWNFRESDAHKYYFYMSGVQSGTKKYNALVTVDAKSDAESDNKVQTVINKKSKMNISVIIPVYNVERYVERCLLSIINQTYTESVECIVVNDCTPDNSMKIVEKLVADYKGSIQFKLLCHKHNRGLAAVRNTGINNAGGKYIVHVDSDDYCEPDMLEKMYIKALETDADIVLADMWRTYPDHEEYCSRQIVSLDKIERLRGCLVGRYGAIIDKMIKRSLYVNNKIQCIEGVNYGEDSLAVLSLFYYANTIVNIPSAFMHYVQYNTASYTKSLSRTSLDNMVEVGERKIALLRQ